MEHVLPGTPSLATEVGILRLRRGAPGSSSARVQLPASSIEPAAVLVVDPPFRTETLAGSRSGAPAAASGQLDPSPMNPSPMDPSPMNPSPGAGISGVGRLRWARCLEGCLHLLAPAEVVALTTAGRGAALCRRVLPAASLTLTDGSPAQLCLTCLAAIPGQSSDRDLAGAR